jgi:hypothetical protein
MRHLREEEQIEEALGEGSPREREQRLRHWSECAECSTELAELRSDLTAAASLVDGGVPERDAAWAEGLWRRVRPQLEPYQPRGWRLRLGGLWPRLAFAAAGAALLAAAFIAGRVWEQQRQPLQAVNRTEQPAAPFAAAAPAAAVPAPPAPQAGLRPVVVVVLSDHLDRSERLLVELKHADLATDETAPALRDEARSLLEANRVARRHAAADPALKGALERLDVLLDDLANHPDGSRRPSWSGCGIR